MKSTPSIFDILIIGAGPAGLACALEAKRAGLSLVVLDKGAVADAIRRFPTNLTFFSTPDLLEIGSIPFLASGFRPTRAEVVRYYQRVASECGLPVVSEAAVVSVRKNRDHFTVTTASGPFVARSVVVATGYFDRPNPFDIPGAGLPKVRRVYDEPFRYHRQKVAVIGGKNSAVEVALDLFRNGSEVTLIHRGSTFSDGVKYWILPDIESRIRNGDIRGLFECTVAEIKPGSIVVDGKQQEEFPNDAVFVMIGYRPETSLLEQAGVNIDRDSIAPLHNPETMETNVEGLFVAGSVAAGRFNNRIFIENGRLHGKMIVDWISKK